MASPDRSQGNLLANAWPTLVGVLVYTIGTLVSLAATWVKLPPEFEWTVVSTLLHPCGLCFIAWGAGQSIRRQRKSPALLILVWGGTALTACFYGAALWNGWQAELLRRGAGG